MQRSNKNHKHLFIMKKLITYIGKVMVLSILIMGLGCENFLQEEPKSFIGPSTFFQTPADAEAAVIAGYDELGAFNPGTFGWWRAWTFEILNDDWDTRPEVAANNSRNLGRYITFDPDAPLLASVYDSWIHGMNTFSTAIDGINEMEDFDGKQALIAEAKFLRAYHYFVLVRLFGPVPIIDQALGAEEARNLPRAGSEEEVYELIISDLDAGVQDLPEQAVAPGRATRWAAMGLLAKVHLTLENWSEAAQLAQSVIQNSPHQLLEEYTQIFSEDNENNSESIFEIQMEVGNERSNQVGQWPRGIGANGDQDYFLGPNWGGVYIATQDLLDDFESGDERRALIDTMVTRNDGTEIIFNADGATPWYSLKRVPSAYIEGREANNNSGYNFIYLRLGEIYLIAAEAENEVNGPGNAYQYINPVRERAGLSPLSGLTQQEFRQAVRKERRTELFDERKRLFDLYRWGTVIERVNEARPDAQIQSHHTLWPIPTNALDNNPQLTQNPGY
ncbi:RagB/SusD family nutrient uptake outer membrane protein [Halalkalibaculum sp. DA384]|uniref:RagB/SusD family nutrient uptake outer membrane protein n=1 Tax=Halalkalibaculum sp. DA384 TaxID=3373606 RepID=UPI00375406ED